MDFKKNASYLIQANGSGTLKIMAIKSVTVTYDAGEQGWFRDVNGEKVHVCDEQYDPEEAAYLRWPETDNETTWFDGWYTDPELTKPVSASGELHFTEDMVLYAKYRTGYTVKLHAGEGMTFGDGSEVCNNMVMDGERRTIRNLGYPSVEGKVVADWYDNPQLSGEPLDKDMVISEAMDLYASWTDAVKIVFDAGEGYFYKDNQGIEYKTQQFNVKKGETVYSSVPRHDSKAFLQWYSTPDFKPGTELPRNTYEIMAEEPVTYYAKYGEGVKVTYNVNGGYFTTPFDSTQIMQKGEHFRHYSGIVAHSDSNKVFEGWSLSKNSKDIITDSYVVNKDITVYAIWGDAVNLKLVGKGIHFVSYGSNQMIEADDEITLKVPKGKTYNYLYGTSTRAIDDSQYIEGWYTDAALKNKINLNTYAITKNMTLYAKLAPRPAYTGYKIWAVEGIGMVDFPVSKEMNVGESNRLYTPVNNTVSIQISSIPANSNLKDMGKATIVSGDSVEYIHDDYYGKELSMFDFYAVKPGTTVIEVEADGKKTEISITVPTKQFDDVTNPKQYYYDAVYWAVDKGITQGNSPTTFNPSGFCKRYQFVLFLWRQKGCPEPKLKTDPFKDVISDPKKDVYEKAVLWAVENGITTGTTPTTFEPYAPLTRGQVVTFMYRAAEEPEVKTTVNPFRDVQAGKYYYKPVMWAVENGITTGVKPDQFQPVATCTRGQTVLFMYRLFK